nr:MAG TPA: hypothetical protein [Caudoviricetes sp.]
MHLLSDFAHTIDTTITVIILSVIIYTNVQ